MDGMDISCQYFFSFPSLSGIGTVDPPLLLISEFLDFYTFLQDQFSDI